MSSFVAAAPARRACFDTVRTRTAITRGVAPEGLDGVQTVSGATALDHDPLDFVERERELVVRAVVELVRGDLLRLLEVPRFSRAGDALFVCM
jgi:hypothetical protein